MRDLHQIAPAEYPVRLNEIPEPPERLFVRGTLPEPERPWLCVIGARRYSAYGKSVCEKLIAGLAHTPAVIVSGLALGVDSLAHRAALSAGLPTVAVPGSGLNDDVLYPATHRGLAKQILDAGGTLVSEFPPEHKARPESFPQRNRIMAGLCHAVLVIEATERSGTLITARLATEYNRDVLTVPGSIFSSNSAGPHLLLRLGATPIRTSADIMDALDIESNSAGDSAEPEHLSEKERHLLSYLSEPQAKDTLAQAVNLPAHETNTILTTLELRGIIVEQGGKVHRA